MKLMLIISMTIMIALYLLFLPYFDHQISHKYRQYILLPIQNPFPSLKSHNNLFYYTVNIFCTYEGKKKTSNVFCLNFVFLHNLFKNLHVKKVK